MRVLLSTAALLMALGGWLGSPASVSADASVSILNATPGVCEALTASACFSPLAITETAGATVIWTNNTLLVHTATSCDPKSCDGQTSPDVFHTGDIKPGASASIRLTVPGVYHYLCAYHGNMNATITVRPSEISAASPATLAAPAITPPPTGSATATAPAEAPVPAPPTSVPYTTPSSASAPNSPATPGPASVPPASSAPAGLGGDTAMKPPSAASRPSTLPDIGGTPVASSGGGGPGPAQVVGGGALLLLGLAVLAHTGLRRWIIRLVR